MKDNKAKDEYMDLTELQEVMNGDKEEVVKPVHDVDMVRAEVLKEFSKILFPRYPATEEGFKAFLNRLKQSTELNIRQVHILTFTSMSDKLRMRIGLKPKYDGMIEEFVTLMISLRRKGILEKLEALKLTNAQVEESEVGRMRKMMTGIRSMFAFGGGSN